MEKLDCKSFMIGDWVHVKSSTYGELNSQVFTIEGDDDWKGVWVRDKKCWGRVNESEIEPIPLTPEILEKNGFVLKPDGWLWCKEEGIEEQNYIFIQFRKGCDEVRLVEFNFVNKVLAKYEQMHYVHELQHAFRMCGVEIKIQL